MSYCRRPITGAKFFISHLVERGLSVDDINFEFPNARWIILYRKNISEQHISLERSRRTREYRKGVYHLKKKVAFEPFEFDSEDAMRFCVHTEKLYRELSSSRALSAENSLWISYEELDEDAQGTFDRRVFSFLDVEKCSVSTNLTKQRSDSFTDTVLNLQKLQSYMLQRIDLPNYLND